MKREPIKLQDIAIQSFVTGIKKKGLCGGADAVGDPNASLLLCTGGGAPVSDLNSNPE